MSTNHLTQERQALERFCSLIESRLGWGPSIQWRDQDFESLSQKIYAVSGVALSVTTLKRIFGKLRYDSVPNTGTLNALAVFAGFGNWLECKEGMQIQVQTQTQTQEQTETQTQKQDHELERTRRRILPSLVESASRRRRVLAFIVTIIFTGAILGFILIRNGHPVKADQDVVTFTSEPVAEGIPNTVVFRYDIGDLKPQRMEIQQSWDTTKRFDVALGTKEATSTYYYPGYFRAKLLLDGHIVKEHDLLMRSNGWLATLDMEPQPRYFLPEELEEREVLGVREDIMQTVQAGSEAPHVSGFHFVDDFTDVYLDDLTFEATIKNTYAEGDGICRITRVVLLGTEGYVIIPFSIPGCTGDLRLIVDDVVHDGRTHNLSALGWDFNYWLKLKCTFEVRRLRIYLNNRIVYGVTYRGGLGHFTGMRFLFTGSGQIDDILVKDGAGRVIYQESF